MGNSQKTNALASRIPAVAKHPTGIPPMPEFEARDFSDQQLPIESTLYSKLRFGVFEKGSNRPCSLLHVHYSLCVEDYSLRTSMIQHFANQNDHPVELVYRFAQSPSSTIFDIEVQLYDPETGTVRTLKAEIQEKLKAQEMYDDAVSSGSTAMLAEKSETDDSVILSLGNIGPKWQVVVRMLSVEELRLESMGNGLMRMRIVIPSLNEIGGVVEGAAKNTSFDCSAQLTRLVPDPGADETRICSFECFPSDFVDSESGISDDGLSGFCRNEENSYVSLDQDIEIRVDVRGTPLVSAVVQSSSDPDEDSREPATSTCMISIVPTLDASSTLLRTEIVVVLDCSGSMAGSRMRHAVAALSAFFQSLYETAQQRQVYCNIVRFGSSHESMSRTASIRLDESGLEKLRQYVDDSSANLGGTYMLGPLQDILDRPVVKKGFSRQILFITDGEDSQADQVIQFVQKHCDTTRVFGVGIGRGINPVLITRVAQVSNGRAVFIEDGNQIETKILEQVRFMAQPSLSDLSVEFRTARGDQVEATNYLSIIPPVFNMLKTTLYYLIQPSSIEDTEITAIVSYVIGTSTERSEVPLRLVETQLATLASRRRVKELDDGKAFQALKMSREQAEEEVRRMGLHGHFITSQTCFILVVENEEAITDEMQVEVIPSVPVEAPKPKPPKKAKRRNRRGRGLGFLSFNRRKQELCHSDVMTQEMVENAEREARLKEASQRLAEEKERERREREKLQTQLATMKSSRAEPRRATSSMVGDLQLIDADDIEIDRRLGTGSTGFQISKGTYAGEIVLVREFEERVFSSGMFNVFKFFEMELKQYSRYSHPSILKYIGYSKLPRVRVLTEYSANATLKIFFSRKSGEFGIHDKREMAMKIADGMKYLHSLQVCHGNLRAENVFVMSDFSPKIDFG